MTVFTVMVPPTLLRDALARLTTPFDPDAYLSLLHPLWGTKLRGVVEAVSPVTAEAAALTIRPSAGWPGHRPGQFVTVGVDVDGVRHHRCYSLTSPPGARDHRGPLIEITVREDPAGTVSPHLVRRTRPGDVVRLSPPAGELTPEFTSGAVLLVTGGSGLTPAIGMLRWLDRERPRGADVVLLHHATDPDRCLHRDELERLADEHEWLRVVTTYTRERGRRRRGTRLDATRLERLCDDWRERTTYACGPEPLLADMGALWEREGIAERLHVERFTSPVGPRSDAVLAGATVRFASSGIDVRSDGEASLLELAERAGLTPPSGCRTGVCHTCSTLLEDGCSLDLRDGRPAEPGQHVQLCVSAPASDLTLQL